MDDTEATLASAQVSPVFRMAMLELGLVDEDLRRPQHFKAQIEQVAETLWRRRIAELIQRVKSLEMREKERCVTEEPAKVQESTERPRLPAPDVERSIERRDIATVERRQVLAEKYEKKMARAIKLEEQADFELKEKNVFEEQAATERRTEIVEVLKSSAERTRNEYETELAQVLASKEQHFREKKIQAKRAAAELEKKLETMREICKELEERRRRENDYQRVEQDAVMDRVLERIEHDQVLKQQRTREASEQRSAKIDEYFGKYEEQLRDKDLELEKSYAKHHAQRSEVLAGKSELAHLQLTEQLGRHQRLWEQVKDQNERLTHNVIQQQKEEAERAEERRNEVMQDSQQRMREELFKAEYGAIKGKMIVERESYNGHLGKARLDEKTRQMVELHSSPKHKREVMEKYTIVGERREEIARAIQFSLEQFLNFDHLEKGYIRGQEIRTMLDMAEFMERTREEEREALLTGASNEYQKTVLREEFCKERRESGKILRILQGMWREEDQGIIV